MKTTSLLLLSIATFLLVACGHKTKSEVAVYEEDWESLAKFNEQPDWLKDAKFGIYFHWGIYSVPAFGNEWYPRNMHIPGTKENLHHIEKYGPLFEFGYHHFVPMFKAENFNATEWADLFKKAGARFAGPVAEHHDGFSMWKSKITPWNAYDKGPHRDLTGELKEAITKDGMKFITTFHHARNLQRYKDMEKSEIESHEDNLKQAFRNSHYPLFDGTFPTYDDPKLNYLYGNMPTEKWEEEVWFGKLKEVIDNYQPDIIWFDSWLDQISEEKRKKFCAYYLNEAHKLDKEVVIIRKQDDLPLTCSIDDLEKSRMNYIKDQLWMTDETVSTGSWCYTENLRIKPAADVLHVLIDIVSKNGVLLLNISPLADGRIPADQKEVLLKIGEWLGKYGEAVYETRPWYTFGEGPTKEPEGSFKNHKEFLKIKYTADDVRYTTQGNSIYALLLGVPEGDKPIKLTAFSETASGQNYKINHVQLLGSNKELAWEKTDEGLIIQPGFELADEMALVFKVDMQ